MNIKELEEIAKRYDIKISFNEKENKESKLKDNLQDNTLESLWDKLKEYPINYKVKILVSVFHNSKNNEHKSFFNVFELIPTRIECDYETRTIYIYTKDCNHSIKEW